MVLRLVVAWVWQIAWVHYMLLLCLPLLILLLLLVLA
jgi:hypothetical protein